MVQLEVVDKEKDNKEMAPSADQEGLDRGGLYATEKSEGEAEKKNFFQQLYFDWFQ